MIKSLRSLVLAALFVPALVSAQTTWWGMTAAGGASGIGSIYSIAEDQTFTKRHDFYRYEGGSPRGELVKASNGLYYGVTDVGGVNGVGVLFSYNPANGAYTVLQNFNSTASTSGSAYGARPYRGLIQASNGRLYGTCTQGGANNLGTLYEYVIGTNTMTKRVDFDNLTTAGGKGSTPRCRLVQASNGLLYGTTQLGGTSGRGVIFSFNPTGNAYTKLYNFPALPGTVGGTQPYGGLIQATGGLLYGTTQLGGANSGGVLFSFNITGNVYTSLYDFATATGRSPLGELLQAPSGVLYGAANNGGTSNLGVIYSYNISTDTYTPHMHLTSASGSAPYGRLMLASDGLLYGTCNQGGTANGGTLYSFNTTTNAYTVEYNFEDGGFSSPWAGMIEDPNGSLLCMTGSGGAGGLGALVKYQTSTNTATELLAFSFSNGATPRGRLVKHTNGKFYGLTGNGGTENAGILFSYDPTTSTFARLFNFTSTFGTFPLGSLVESGGKLYGMCSSGTPSSGGCIFEFNVTTGVCTKKHDLAALTVGTGAQNGFFKASNGKLYGNTAAGAANGLGGLFEYVPATNAVTKLVDFSTTTGSQPLADMMQASNGLLYGTCSANGQFSKGTLFSLDPATNTRTTLFNFDGLQGAVPAGDLVQAANGLIYGTTREEGQGFNGNIYSWNIATNTYSEEYSFNLPPLTTDGRQSEANLILGTDGLLYGTASLGGTNDLGILFRFNTATLTLTTLQTFAGTTNGATPLDGLTSDVAPVTNNSITVNAKAFLEGPFNTGSGTMNTNLRTLGSFPTTEPFTAAGFTIVGGGGETINASVLTTTGNDAVVDWVLLELRDKNTPTTVLRTKACLLQSDGNIVDVDNSSVPTFPFAADNYHISVRHRNHLAVMTSASVPLSASSALVDFTSPAQGNFGTNAQKTIGAVRAMWAGNALRNTNLQYTGAGNDRDPILIRVGSTTPNNTVSGYYQEDTNMNGTVQYTGAGNDRDLILVNVGSTTPNNTLLEQLP